jgi:hypothetical protein
VTRRRPWNPFRKDRPPPAPDWSHVDTPEKAVAAWQRGELVKLLLMPQDFGGADVPANVVYVPDFVVDVKAGIDMNVIMPMIQRGEIHRYEVEPRYEGRSVVPGALAIVASEPGSFQTQIRIWGRALAQG